MEPEIIRMYSSSPPPLDSVADDDDDDGFGEFGGFSDGSPGVGFANFDAVGYPKTREDFIPSKHFLPIHNYSENVNNFSSLTSITSNENISEISLSKKGPCSVFETNINEDTTQFNVTALDDNGSSGVNDVKYFNSETHLTCAGADDGLRSRSQEQIVSTCNGEKIHSLENLTNGFGVEDGNNPQGLQDRDTLGHSKGFQSISSHSTDLSIDFSPPSPGEDFADFATFSSRDPVDTDDASVQPPKGSHEGQTQSINVCTESSRFDCGSVLTADLVQDSVSQVEIEEPDTLALESVSSHETMSATLDSDVSDSMRSLDTKNTSTLPESKKEEDQTLNEISSSSCDESLETSKDVRKRGHGSDIEGGQTMNVSCVDPDFDAALPVTDKVTADKKHDPDPLEQSSSGAVEVNEKDFGRFEDTNVVLQEEETSPSEKLSSKDKREQWASEELDEFSGFGSFAPLAEKEESNVKQDSDDFTDFSTVGSIQHPTDWNAFEQDQGGSSSWAAFGDQKMESSTEPDWQSFRTDIPSSTDDQVVNAQSSDLPAVHELEATLVCEDSQIAFQNPLLSRLERVIQACFPPPPVADLDEKISPLDILLCTEQREETAEPTPAASSHTEVLDIWTELQDIHDAYGLKYQWGGSHSNKKLLRSLGIDTRNILFTGNKKQPVIVPMYAAGLGMLEPTKEPLKPLSAAEKIASIGQSSPVPPDDSICSSDQLQESLPPVQFDWSSSGLTNPLDGVDPELYALTTAKVECSIASSKVTDAFARLMSTAETTSTSARKPRRDEILSEEAAKVIASLPDLSFMHAKVLMFPVSLTPLTSSQD